jgi:hypothetical protein
LTLPQAGQQASVNFQPGSDWAQLIRREESLWQQVTGNADAAMKTGQQTARNVVIGSPSVIGAMSAAG